MNTCLTNEMCKGGKNKYYFQWCIYHKNNYNYSPNYNISCHPEERINKYTSCQYIGTLMPSPQDLMQNIRETLDVDQKVTDFAQTL